MHRHKNQIVTKQSNSYQAKPKATENWHGRQPYVPALRIAEKLHYKSTIQNSNYVLSFKYMVEVLCFFANGIPHDIGPLITHTQKKLKPPQKKKDKRL